MWIRRSGKKKENDIFGSSEPGLQLHSKVLRQITAFSFGEIQMKYLKQTSIIIGFSFAGEILHHLIPFPIPASIYGIILLFTGLMSGLIKPEQIKESGEFLILIMPMLFIPSIAGLINVWDMIRTKWLQYLVMIFLTTVIVMTVSGRVTQALLHKDSSEYE